MKRFTLALFTTLALGACSEQKGTEQEPGNLGTQDKGQSVQVEQPKGAYAIKGQILDGDGNMVYLDQWLMQSSEVMGSAQPDENGHFQMGVEKYSPGVYRLRQGPNNYISFIISAQQDINLKIKFNDPKSSVFDGAPETYSLLPLYGATIKPADVRKFVDTTSSELAAWFMVRTIQPQDKESLAYWKKTLEKVQKKYPNSSYATEMQSIVFQIDQQLNPKQQSLSAPDFSLPNPEGKLISLSSLRGKVVLLDFWASWCRPCRMENPNVVNVYNKYKDKGFTVMSVSLDQAKDAWVQAIKQDGLIWPNHVSELQGWQGPLNQVYGIQSIPKTLLLDRKGKIIATDLRGPALEAKLKEVL